MTGSYGWREACLGDRESGGKNCRDGTRENGGEALQPWLEYAKKDQQKLSVLHPEKSSISINDKTPKREHTHDLDCKLTSLFRFKL